MTVRAPAGLAALLSDLAQHGVAGIGPALGADTVATSLLGKYRRCDFSVGGKRAFVIAPARAGKARRWLWYQPTLLGAHPTDPNINPGSVTYPNNLHAWLFTRLLAKGFHISGVETGETYGNMAGRTTQTAFYQAVVHTLGLAAKARLLPQSRGGLMHYNWAAEHPESVRCIGAIYPVTDIHTWVGVERIAQLGYGLPAAEILAHMDLYNPLDRLAPLAAQHVPILHVHGDQDTTVPIDENTWEFARRYRALGGEVEVVVIAGKGHTSEPEFFQEPRLLEFFLAH